MSFYISDFQLNGCIVEHYTSQPETLFIYFYGVGNTRNISTYKCIVFLFF